MSNFTPPNSEDLAKSRVVWVLVGLIVVLCYVELSINHDFHRLLFSPITSEFAVAKTCPHCGYNPIGPFIDNCPMCAEPVRNVCSNARGYARPTKRPQWWVIGMVAVAVMVVAGYWILGVQPQGRAVNDSRRSIERSKAEADALRRSRTVILPAAQLLQEFQNNPDADRKYKGKCLEILGFVERVVADGDDAPMVVLHAGDERTTLKIECFFENATENDENRIKRLRKNQTITVTGEYDGRENNLQLRDCVLSQ